MIKFLSFFLCLCCANVAFAQQNNATLVGKIVDISNQALADVNISIPEYNTGISTDADGNFSLKNIPIAKNITINFSKINYKTKKEVFVFKPDETKNIVLILDKKKGALNDVIIKESRNRGDAGNIKIDAKQAAILPSTIGGIEGLLKIFVGSNNELTSQYNVRGGNFDENLVYVNDFEIYRPFLVRSGQQEGLSFINSDLVQGVNFSTGGFQAKYGDKMSSVLDVQYKKPKEFAGSITASMLGLSAHIEGTAKHNRLTYLLGLRQKSNQYLLQAQPTSGQYNPSFTDAQALVHYDFNTKWQMDVLGNYARNRFDFIPVDAEATFGAINQAYKLQTYFKGNEADKFDSRFAGISFTNTINKKLSLKYLVSGYQTNEFETYDISGEYVFGEIETDLGKDNFGQIKYALGTGIIHNYARNYLTMNVGNAGIKGVYDGAKHYWQFGVNAETVNINDKLNEWERRDSAGFTQPVNDSLLLMNTRYKSTNNLSYQRYTAFLQDNISFDSIGVTVNYGARMNYSTLSKELLISPRVQANLHPRNWKNDIVFRSAVGLYQQPPFYREIRDLDGSLNMNVKAQKSFHALLGLDYNFKAWDRPFKLTTESYYKNMWDLVPYEYDNIRIRYWGRNDAVGYAYGTEFRLYGQLVKDAESWLSMNIMKTSENILDDKAYTYNSAGTVIDSFSPGYIPRPTDSRVTFGMFFQDYFPSNHNIKVHLNGMYATGLPFGPPDRNRYNDVLRLPSYRRVDIGFSMLLVDAEKKNKPYYSLFHKFKNMWLSAEVFNLLGIKNTLSYQWIQDQTSGRNYAVPNRLTSRLLNVKLNIAF